MKVLVAAALFLLLFGDAKEYPLRLRIVQMSQHRASRDGFTSGHGVANLRGEDGIVHGIEFDFDGCDHPLRAPSEPISYAARIKKEGRLEVLSHNGGNKTEECELKYTPHDFRYVFEGGQLVTRPPKVIPLNNNLE